MKLKMSRKWPENGYCEQPYFIELEDSEDDAEDDVEDVPT